MMRFVQAPAGGVSRKPQALQYVPDMRIALAASLAFLPAACGQPTAGPVEIALIDGGPVVPDAGAVKKGGISVAPLAPVLVGATRAGLVGFDAEGRIVPALAERWIVTDDGLGYIFRLRDGVWNDGTPIAAPDVVSALRRTFADLHDRDLARDLPTVRAIKVMARRVIEIDLDAPQPDFLTLLAQPELGIGAGPHGQHEAGMMDVRREGDGIVASLVAPDHPGLPLQPPPASERPLAIRNAPAQLAIDRFVAGKVDLVLGGTYDTVPLAERVGAARGSLQLDPVPGLFGLDVTATQGFLADPANREAVAMAIDRDKLVAAFGVNGWQATTRLVTAGLEGDPGLVGERWADLPLDQRRTQAAVRVAGWIKAHAPASVAPVGGQNGVQVQAQGAFAPPVLLIALPDGPGAALIFEHLHDDLAGIGLDLRRAAVGQGADLVLLDTVARYPRPRWFLQRMSCAAHPVGCSQEGDADLAQALSSPDPVAAGGLLADAEAKITAANGFIPLARPLRWSLVRSGLAGFSVNAIGWHALVPLAASETVGN